MDQVNEQRVMRKIFWRLTPLLMFLYFIAYIDRVNVGFAALTMNKDIGINSAIYGMGAGIFFWGYFFFEVPSNLLMEKVGARLWIARILFTWGLVACAMVFVKGATSFLTLRFLLGVAEAGFFPGVILYLTYWFPARYRGRIISRFMLSIPLSLGIGAPISAAIMQLHGAFGLKGWQWVFLLEGIPAVLVPILVLTLLPDKPAKAKWLNEDEKKWLEEQMVTDRENVAVKKTESGAMKIFANPMVWAFGIMYFASTGSNYGLSLFFPQIIKSLGFTIMQTGWIMLAAYVIGCISMLTFGWFSDRFKERKWHYIGAMMLVTLGFLSAGLVGASIMSLVLLTVANIGINGSKGPFWPLPSAYLTGSAAAAGIAFINSVGNLGGFFGPAIIGWAKQLTGSYSAGLYAMTVIAFSGVILALIAVRNQKAAPVPETTGPKTAEAGSH